MDLSAYLKRSESSQAAFAQRVGVTQSRVSQWLNGETIPAERCVKIEQATGGKVTRQELRPDLFNSASRDTQTA
jgi:DNA-binding transcriptional regulator YdaS (Cro superfamily)